MKVAVPSPDGGQPLSAAEVSRGACEECPICGSHDLFDNRCKTVCRNCRTILRSCADL